MKKKEGREKTNKCFTYYWHLFFSETPIWINARVFPFQILNTVWRRRGLLQKLINKKRTPYLRVFKTLQICRNCDKINTINLNYSLNFESNASKIVCRWLASILTLELSNSETPGQNGWDDKQKKNFYSFYFCLAFQILGGINGVNQWKRRENVHLGNS